MSTPSTLHRITPDELPGIIARVREEAWPDLVLVGPDHYLTAVVDDWKEPFRGHEVFQVTEHPGNLANLLQDLENVRLLVVKGLGVGDAGTQAIAQRLSNLISLDLGSNQVGDAGARAIAEHLTSLTSLNLGWNQVGNAGARAVAERLISLTSLNLRYNKVGDAGARAIAEHLISLTSLNLWYNQVGNAGARAIAEHLTNLISLNLWNNQVGKAGARAIAEHLTNLTSLNLGNNQVGKAGTRAIAERLTNLTSLNLGDNQVGDAGTRAIAERLTNLTSLDLWGNRVGNAGARAIAERLTNLTSLELGTNQLGDAGTRAIAERLTNLTSLGLRSNQVGDAGARAIASHLTSLTSLELGDNQVGDAGTRAIAERLINLTSLNLQNNQLTDLNALLPLLERGLSIQWKRFGSRRGINVHGCPLERPTPSVVQQGTDAVLNYFRGIEQQGHDYLYEAKVLVIGQGGAGKTSLIRRLYQPEEPLPEEHDTTRGIDIHRSDFRCPDGTSFRLNVWDFGGQQIYHATHQFFLTKSSLYVLVDDTRTDDTSVHDESFKNWLGMVETFGGKSPVLIFQNEKGGRSKEIDEAGIKGRFANVITTYAGNLREPGSADALSRAIEHIVQDLPHVGNAVPAKWVDVRATIEERAKTEPYLSLNAYLDLYATHLEADRTKALLLSGYLHDLGVFLHFQDDKHLRDTVILQNRWATDAVFCIIDDEHIKQVQRGRFTHADCDRLWADPEYVDKHPQLLALMEKFELCYKLADTRPDTWLVPQLLSPSAPSYTQGWDAPDDLVRSYAYSFLPRGLVSRLMVRMHRFVARPDLAWANGALFEQGDTELLARVEASGDTITLRARGPERKALMSVIASALDALNASFKGLEGKVRTSVPCTCEECRTSITPELFELQHLRFRRQKNKLTIECRRSFENVDVLELLDGLRLDALPGWARDTPYLDDALHDPDSLFGRDASFGRDARRYRPPPAPRTVKIFLASSEELHAERDAFELHFRRKNDFLIDRGIRLQIVRWEHFLDAMSETRLQDEYNREVRAADLFVSLFMTKTGTYTEEEFNVAHDTFQSTGAPLIYTYFKDTPTTMGTVDLEDLKSLRAFQAKLSKLGHFWTKYETTAGLMLHFEGQLQRLEAEGRL